MNLGTVEGPDWISLLPGVWRSSLEARPADQLGIVCAPAKTKLCQPNDFGQAFCMDDGQNSKRDLGSLSVRSCLYLASHEMPSLLHFQSHM